MTGERKRRSSLIHIREITIADYKEMLALQELCGLHVEKLIRESRPAVARQLRFNRGLSFAAFDRARMVAVARGSFDARRGYIDRVAVHPDYRRRGLGTKVVARVEKALWATGGRYIVVSAIVETGNASSRKMFEKLGFETVPVLYMRKRPPQRSR
ncbi:MAG TPA: GNAT family N-acetyltransferase [Thermoplasmata archaeon]|nr:GNAT family N-acetyltransferase [Thermoplasmata archaeon]